MFDTNALKAQVSLETVVASRVGAANIKNAGRDSKKLRCPFHDEKTPSFHINVAQQYYNCFGCGVGGDVITFVQEYDRIDFLDAVRTLAETYGIDLGETEQSEDGLLRQHIFAANKDAAHLYAAALADSRAIAAQNLLRNKGFTGELIAPFEVGYAPGTGTYLLDALTANGHSRDTLDAANLITLGRNNRPFDRYRNRIVFPIRNARGEYVGFQTRRVDDDGSPKYINTSSTPVYNKARTLYNINQAKTVARRERWIGVCEGPTDAIATALAGVGNVVASCGTAFGVDHVRTVANACGDDVAFVFGYDGDGAGRAAAAKAWDILKHTPHSAYIALMPDGRDPNDQYLVDPNGLTQAYAERTSLPRYLIDNALAVDLSDPDTASEATRTAVTLTTGMTDKVAQAKHLDYIASRVGVPVDNLPTGTQPRKRQTPTSTAPAAPETGGFLLDREALKLLAQYPEATAPLTGLRDAFVGESSTIYSHLISLRHTTTDTDTSMVDALNQAGEFPYTSTCFRLLVEPIDAAQGAPIAEYAQSIADRLRTRVTRAAALAEKEALIATQSDEERRQRLQAIIARQRERHAGRGIATP